MFNYSIVIPHHNCPDLLSRLIDSIPEREDIQIIVVDDASDPNVVDFSKYVFPSNKTIEFYQVPKSETKGGGHARNVGMEHIKGNWALFADSDDFYANEAFDVLDRYVDSDLDVIYFNCKSVHSKTLEPASRANEINSFIKRYTENPCKDNLDQLKYNAHEPWNKMVRYSFLKKHGIKFEEVRKANDILFTFMVGYFAQDIEVDNNYVYVCTFRDDSITYSINKVEYAIRKYEFGLSRNYFFKKNNLTRLKESDFIGLLRILKNLPTSNWIAFFVELLRSQKRIRKSRTKYVDTANEIKQNVMRCS